MRKTDDCIVLGPISTRESMLTGFCAKKKFGSEPGVFLDQLNNSEEQ